MNTKTHVAHLLLETFGFTFFFNIFDLLDDRCDLSSLSVSPSDTEVMDPSLTKSESLYLFRNRLIISASSPYSSDSIFGSITLSK